MTESSGRGRPDASGVPLPTDEQQRLAAVRSTGLIGSEADPAFDAVTQFVAAALDAPIALFTLLDQDRQWFASNVGLDRDGTPREDAFCSHAIMRPAEIFVVEDARDDPRFAANPLVIDDPRIRFYAGAPVRGPNGRPLGTLCVLDTDPRQLRERDANLLRRGAAQIEVLVASRIERDEAVAGQRRVETRNTELLQELEVRGTFLAMAQHKLKTPLAVLSGWSAALRNWDELDAATRTEGLVSIERAAAELRSQIDDLLDEARSQLLEQAIAPVPIHLAQFVRDQVNHTQVDPSTHVVRIDIPDRLLVLADAEGLRHVLAHLLDNAIKYSPDGGPIDIAAERAGSTVALRITDSGIGLTDDVPLFEPFQRSPAAVAVARGTGLGLYIVQSLVRKMNGVVAAISEDVGTTFEVILPEG